MIELGLGEQPAAGDLGAGHRALGHHFIDLAFLEAEIAGGFGGGEKLHAAHLHSYASFLDNAKNYRKNKAVSNRARQPVCENQAADSVAGGSSVERGFAASSI